MKDGFVKSPDAALRFISRRCGVRKSTPHSSGPGAQPGSPASGTTGRNESAFLYLTGTCRTKRGMSIARLACGLFTKPSHFRNLDGFWGDHHE